MIDYKNLEFHPYCLAIPAMPEQEFVELKEDISGSGLLDPIVIFEGMILDGRHRYRACVELEIEPWFKDFDGPDSALDFVISKNFRRRSLTASQKAMALEALCNVRHGSNQYQIKIIEEVDAPMGASTFNQEEAAKEAGIGRMTIQRARQVAQSGSNDLVEAVRSGEIAVRAAAEVIDMLPEKELQNKALESAKEKPRKIVAIAKALKEVSVAKPYITLSQWEKDGLTEVPAPGSDTTFNRQSDNAEDSMGNIEWASWSWNPVTGCKHDCSYCYARDIANRFYSQGFEPTIHPDRLTAPYTTKLPKDADTNPAARNVFANSMSDLYGRWVPQEWVDAVFKAMSENPQWNFLTLTKFPKRAAELVYPKNVWIGTSVDLQSRVKSAEDAFEKIDCGVRWLSIEPMIEPLKFSRPQLFDWVVIGGASKSNQTPAWTPPFEWVVRVASQFLDANPAVKIYLKTNGRPREFPGVITQTSAPEAFHYLKKTA